MQGSCDILWNLSWVRKKVSTGRENWTKKRSLGGSMNYWNGGTLE